MRQRKPNIIGFDNKQSNIKYHHCQIHQGCRLLPYPAEEGMYYCPLCGTPYSPNETKSDTKISSKFGVVNTGPMIVSPKREKKEYYDKQGNLINKEDSDIIADLTAGHTIDYYHTDEEINKKEPHRFIVRK